MDRLSQIVFPSLLVFTDLNHKKAFMEGTFTGMDVVLFLLLFSLFRLLTFPVKKVLQDIFKFSLNNARVT